jgi:membrane fusion protein (multidrug efflux system)
MNRSLLALILALGMLPGCGLLGGKDKSENDDDSADDDDSAAQVEDERVPVRVVALEKGSIAERIATSATVDSDQRADILVETTGTVESITVEEGASVQAGTVLASLRNPQLKGEYDRAKAEYDRAKEDFESVKSLFEKGFVARNEYETSAYTFDTARLGFEQAQSAYSQRELRSPIRGTVSMRDLRFGEAASPPKLAFQVVDLSRLKVDVSLPERDLSRIAAKQPARIRTEVLEGIEVSGRVERISPVVDAQTGTVKVTIAVDAGQKQLRPGMFVNVDIVVATHEDAVLLPKRALVYAEGQPYVFVLVEKDGKTLAERRSVKLGVSEDDRVELLDGAEPGDRVITVGQSTLRDGGEVRVHEPPVEPSAEPESAG